MKPNRMEGAFEVEWRPLKELAAYEKNSRRHSDEQIDRIAASIETWGWTMPVLVSEDGTIIAGHARVAAAFRLGLDKAPCRVAVGWSEDETSEWDMAVLGEELDALKLTGFDLDLTGWADAEVDTILAKMPELDRKVEKLRPIKMTHILISVPTNAGVDFLEEALAEVKARGGRVDHGGN